MKILALWRPDNCANCGNALAIGTKAAWDAAGRTGRCLSCVGAVATTATPATRAAVPTAITAVDVLPSAQPPGAAPAEPGPHPPASTTAAGGSAQREYDRRSQRREATVRGRHPRLGGLLLALSNEPTSTRVWAQGAHAERAVAATLE